MLRTLAFLESLAGLLAAFIVGISIPLGGLILFIERIANDHVVQGIGAFAGMILTGWSSGLVIRLASRWEREGMRRSFETDAAGPADDRLPAEDFAATEEIPERDRRTLVGFMASSLPSMNWPFRVWCWTYWNGLVLAAAMLGHAMCKGAIVARARNPEGTLLFSAACVGHLAFMFAANLYLVLAAAVVLREWEYWKWFYRSRLIIALGATGLSIASVLLP